MFAVSHDPPGADRAAVDAERGVCDDVVDEVMTATRALIGLSTRTLGVLAEDLSAAQYRTLVVLASRGPQRMVDLAQLQGVNPSTAGRMCDRLARRGFVRRQRARGDRNRRGVAEQGRSPGTGRGHRGAPRGDHRGALDAVGRAAAGRRRGAAGAV